MSDFIELWPPQGDAPFILGDEVWAQNRRYRGVVINIYKTRWNGGEPHMNLLVEGWKLVEYENRDNCCVSQILAEVTTCELINRPEPEYLEQIDYSGGDEPDPRVWPPAPKQT